MSDNEVWAIKRDSKNLNLQLVANADTSVLLYCIELANMANMDKCDYKTLGLAPGASIEEVKKAFRTLAKRLHPDKSKAPDATERFKDLNRAYAELLKNAKPTQPDVESNQRQMDITKTMPDMKVTEHSQCIVLDIGKEQIGLFHQICVEFYGPPVDLKSNGRKFSKQYKPLNDDKSNLGTIHVTIYLTSGRVLVQGTCYLLWHAEYLPHLMTMMVNNKTATPCLEDSHDIKPADESESTNNCSVCDYQDSGDMLACDACEQWLHYSCSKLFPERLLREMVDQCESVFVCWKCTTPPDDNPVSHHPALENTPPNTDLKCVTSAIQALEKNIVENIKLSSLESARNLNEKHNIELELIRERHKSEVKALKSKITELDEKLKNVNVNNINSTYTTAPPVDPEKETLIRELRAEILCKDEKISDLKDQIKTLKVLNSQLDARMKDLKHLTQLSNTENERLNSKVKDLEETNKTILNHNHKLNEDLWSAKRKNAETHVAPKVTANSPEMNGNRGTDSSKFQQNAAPMAPAADDDTANNNHNKNSRRETRPSETSIEDRSPSDKSPEDTRPKKTRKGGHLIITSSLGKDLDPEHIAPAAKQKICVKSIRGGKIEDLTAFMKRTPYQHKSVNLLVGGNDIDGGLSVELCYNNYTELITAVRDNNPGATINIMEVPQRIHNESASKQILQLNEQLYDLCTLEEYNDCYFYYNGMDRNPKFFQNDGIHLSTFRGGGASRLAMSFRRAVLDSESSNDPADDVPSTLLASPSQSERVTPGNPPMTNNQTRHSVQQQRRQWVPQSGHQERPSTESQWQCSNETLDRGRSSRQNYQPKGSRKHSTQNPSNGSGNLQDFKSLENVLQQFLKYIKSTE